MPPKRYGYSWFETVILIFVCCFCFCVFFHMLHIYSLIKKLRNFFWRDYKSNKLWSGTNVIVAIDVNGEWVQSEYSFQRLTVCTEENAF